MNRTVWIGGLFLSLCGWACQAGAQEVEWGPSMQPAVLLPPTRLEALPDVGATLGRPVPVPAACSDPGVVTASYHDGEAPTPVPRGSPDAVDGPDAPAESLFASDRRAVRPAVYAGESIAVPPRPGPAADAGGPVVESPFPSPPPEEDAAAAGESLFGLFPALDGLSPRCYVRGEYLLYAFKKDHVPPLVTTSAPQDFGILTGPTTRTLFGGDGLDSGSHSGGRFTLGFWPWDCDDKAVELTGFFFPGNGRQELFSSALFPVLARPFFSLNRGTEFAQLTAFPGESTGNVQVRNSSDLWGLEANLRCKLCCGSTGCDDGCGGGWNYRVDGLVGFRNVNLDEDLTISENVLNLPTAPAGRQNLAAFVFDDFATHNHFYGGQVGLDAEVGRGPWSLEVLGKLALGDTSQQININGGQRVTNLVTGVTTPFVGGLLALPTNIGSHHQDHFSVVPEVNATVSYHFNEHWRVFAGYDFLYWTNVVRPGQQIDRQLDESLIPNFDRVGPGVSSGLNRPAVPFRQSDFWAQGLNLGLEFRY